MTRRKEGIIFRAACFSQVPGRAGGPDVLRDESVMKFGELLYGIKQGFKSIGQNRMFSLAAIGTITACLFLFGIFYFILSNFQYMLKNMESNIGVSVFFDVGISEGQIEDIGKEIEACKAVERVEFVSASEAWEKFQSEMSEEEAGLAETFEGDNPLQNSASYEVYFSDISQQEEVAAYIEEIQGVRQVYSSRTVAGSLNSFHLLISYVSISIVGILLAVSVFLISTTVSVGISVRRQEIYIMRLVGATDLFVKIPFIVEGMVIGLVGAALPLGLLHILYEEVVSYVTESFPMLSEWVQFLDVDAVFRVLVPVALITGIGIGVAGSLYTVRKHLRVY